MEVRRGRILLLLEKLLEFALLFRGAVKNDGHLRKQEIVCQLAEIIFGGGPRNATLRKRNPVCAIDRLDDEVCCGGGRDGHEEEQSGREQTR